MTTLPITTTPTLSLSSAQCPGLLGSVTFFTDPGRFGVPAYLCSRDTFDPRQPLPVPRGARFVVSDGGRRLEEIRIDPRNRQSSRIYVTDFLDAVADQSSLIAAELVEGRIRLFTRCGGTKAGFVAQDRWGSPLATLGMGQLEGRGTNRLRLSVHVPASLRALCGRPFAVLASSRPGSTRLLGRDLPLAGDSLFALTVEAALDREVTGFVGRLGPDRTASLIVPESLLERTGLDGELHLAFLVLTEARDAVELVSNRFTVRFA